jgi:hypothetical protein
MNYSSIESPLHLVMVWSIRGVLLVLFVIQLINQLVIQRPHWTSLPTRWISSLGVVRAVEKQSVHIEDLPPLIKVRK